MLSIAHEQLGEVLKGNGWLAWAASWVDWAAGYIPSWVPGAKQVSSAALLGWINDMLKGLDEFIKGLKPAATLSLTGEGEYKGYGQAENIKGGVGIDVGAFSEAVRGKLAAVAKYFGYEGTATGIETLGGKATLVEFDIPAVTRRHGWRSMLPRNFRAGPVIGWLMSVIGAPFGFIRRLIFGP